RRELEHVADQQIRVVLGISVEPGRRGPGEDVARALQPEQAARHGRPRTHQRRVEHPPPGPARLEALPDHGEVGSRGASPVMWHFRQGALTLANNCRAMVRSASVSGSSFSAMNGCACQERASKKRTSLRISPSEKLKLGILAFRYWRTPSRFVSLSLSAGLLRKRISHWGLTRAPSPI